MKTKNVLVVILLIVTLIALVVTVQNYNQTVSGAAQSANRALEDQLPTLAVLPTAITNETPAPDNGG